MIWGVHEAFSLLLGDVVDEKGGGHTLHGVFVGGRAVGISESEPWKFCCRPVKHRC